MDNLTIHRDIFVTIRYQVSQFRQANRLKNSYLKRGYSLESPEQPDFDEHLFVQLMKSSTHEVKDG